MRFTDAQLQKCYDQNFAEAKDSSEPLRQVHALIGVYDWFQMLEGQHSPRVHEVMDHLLLPEVRAGLREWYQRPGAEKDSATVEFRTQLNGLAGEQLEIGPEVSTIGERESARSLNERKSLCDVPRVLKQENP